MHKILLNYSSPLQKENAKLDRRIQEIYKDMTAPLGIKRHTHWLPHHGVAGALGLIAYAGIKLAAIPYVLLTDKYIRNAHFTGRANQPKESIGSTVAEVAKTLAFPFLALGAGLAYTEKSHRIRNEAVLRSGEEGKDPAVFISGKTNEFTSLALVFPDGLILRKEHGNSDCPSTIEEQSFKLHSRAKDDYTHLRNLAGHIEVSEQSKKEAYELVKKKEHSMNEWRLFREQTRGKELAFLKASGFKED